ncbi:MAG: hypothetical protein WB615_09060, partial [Candidatus Tumulicola sp.]
LDRLLVRGGRGLWCTFAGYDVNVQVRKHHGLGAAAPTTRVRSIDASEDSGVRLRALASQPAAPQRRERHAAVR